MHTIYDVPIVPYNLRREETVVQIAEALNYLGDVTTDIFARINKRIAENKKHVDTLAQRLATASTKLNNLAGARKATQVFSSSKYPGESVNHQYRSIFCSNDDNKLPLKKIHYDYKADAVSSEPLEPLQLYYVKVKPCPEKNNTDNSDYTSTNVEAINDVIVFNTGVFCNDLVHKSSSGQLGSTAKKPEKEANNVDIVAAPISISENLIGQKRSMNDAYFYSPHLGNVPKIDVPLDLPDLPGIADDLRYKTQTEPVIAPSLTLTTTLLPDLPAIEDDYDEEIISVIPNIKHDQINLNLNSNSEDVSAINNEDVESFNAIPVDESDKEHVDVKVEETITSKVVSSSKEEEEIVPKSPVVSDARANLMQAIRQAGGAKTLKPVDDTNKSKTACSSAPAADLMADLHAKLAMRRKGISTNKVENPSTMDKISAMIPPPPVTDDTSESNEEDDWDE